MKWEVTTDWNPQKEYICKLWAFSIIKLIFEQNIALSRLNETAMGPLVRRGAENISEKYLDRYAVLYLQIRLEKLAGDRSDVGGGEDHFCKMQYFMCRRIIS